MNNQANTRVVVIVALIGLAGVILTGVLAFNGGQLAATNRIIDATVTAEAKLTASAGNTEQPGAATPLSPTASSTSMMQTPLASTMTPTSAPATSTPTLTLTPQPDTPTPTPQPDTPTATLTPQPDTPTPQPDTQADSILGNEETWYANGWELTVSNFTYDAIAHIHFALRNNTGREVIFPEISSEGVTISSDVNDLFMSCGGYHSGYDNVYWETVPQTKLLPGETMEWDWVFHYFDKPHNYCIYWGDPIQYSAGAQRLTLRVPNIGNVIKNARWAVEIPRP